MRREAEFEQPLKKDAFMDGMVNSRVLSLLFLRIFLPIGITEYGPDPTEGGFFGCK